MAKQPGEILREARQALGPEFYQEDLADAVGVHVSTVSRWENGERRPTLEQSFRLERFFEKKPIPVPASAWVTEPASGGEAA